MKAANTNSKESDRRKAIPTNKHIRAFLIIGVIIAFLFSIPYFVDWYYQKWVACCRCAEADAATINSAISVYYAIPEIMDFPELETLIEEQSLRFCDGPGQHTFTIEQIPAVTETIEQIPTLPDLAKITVLLNEDCHCQDGDKFIAYWGDPDDIDLPIQEEGWYFSE